MEKPRGPHNTNARVSTVSVPLALRYDNAWANSPPASARPGRRRTALPCRPRTDAHAGVGRNRIDDIAREAVINVRALGDSAAAPCANRSVGLELGVIAHRELSIILSEGVVRSMISLSIPVGLGHAGVCSGHGE